jgi:hypothetical protein
MGWARYILGTLFANSFGHPVFGSPQRSGGWKVANFIAASLWVKSIEILETQGMGKLLQAIVYR